MIPILVQRLHIYTIGKSQGNMLFGDFQSCFFALFYTLSLFIFPLQKTGFKINGTRHLKHE